MWCVLSCNSAACGISGVGRGQGPDDELPGVGVINDSADAIILARSGYQSAGSRSGHQYQSAGSQAGRHSAAVFQSGGSQSQAACSNAAAHQGNRSDAVSGTRSAVRRSTNGSLKGLVGIQVLAEDTDQVRHVDSDGVDRRLDRQPSNPFSILSDHLGNIASRVQHSATEFLSGKSRASSRNSEGEQESKEQHLSEISEEGEVRSAGEESMPLVPSRRRSVLSVCNTAVSAALGVNVDNFRELSEFYTLGNKLGAGHFASVYEATSTAAGAKRAVKSLLKDGQKAETLAQEINMMKMVDHPHIVKAYEVFEDESNLYLVMELCTGGDLDKLVRSTGIGLAEPDAAVAIIQVLKGVRYLHQHHIVHRDIKAKNIMISVDLESRSVPVSPSKASPSGGSDACRGKRLLSSSLADSLRICDFGIACTFTPGETLREVVGTPSHVAPQVLKRKYTHACDVWSSGIVLYNMLSGEFPFPGETDQEIVEAVKQGYVEFGRAFVDHSTSCMELVRKMLTYNESNRVTATGVMEHPWVKSAAKTRISEIKPEIVSSLRGFRNLNKFKRAALSVMVSLVPEEQISAARAAFHACDVDGDGYVTVAELRQLLICMKLKKKELEETLSFVFQEDREAGVQAGTKKKKGAADKLTHLKRRRSFKDDEQLAPFSYTEFLAATYDRTKLNPKLCRATFRLFDKDGSGTLSRSELLDGTTLGKMTEEEVAELLEDMDDNADGEIDFDEFVLALEPQKVRCFGSEFMSVPASKIWQAQQPPKNLPSRGM